MIAEWLPMRQGEGSQEATVDGYGAQIRSARGRYGFAVLTVVGAAILMVGWLQFFVARRGAVSGGHPAQRLVCR